MKAKSSFAFIRSALRVFYYSAPIILTCSLFAATNDLSGLLQKGLFEEEANRNLDAATAAYQTLVTQFDKDRQIGATAIFRLGEVYRKQGKTNEAAAQYERIVRDFAEQTTLVTLSRQNLAGLRPPDNRSTWTPPQTSLYQMRDEIQRYRQLIAIYQALPETNRLDTLCALFANDDVVGADCHEAALVRSNIKRLLRDDLTPNHPAVVKLQIKLQPLETKIEAYARKKIEELVPLVASLEKELQRREAIEESTPGTTASGNRDPDLAQLNKLSRTELLQVLPTLVPDKLLTKLLEQLQTTQTKQAELRHDLGPDHPDVKRLVAVEKTLHEQIDQRVTGILKALELRSSVSSASKPTATVSTVLDEEETEIRRIQAMIQNSPDLINAPRGGVTPLVQAASSGQLRVATFLLDHGADVNLKANNTAPLHGAAVNGHRAMVDLLLSRRADVDAKDSDGRTALHTAAASGYGSVAEALLQHKADVNARDSQSKNQQTPLHLAAMNGHPAIVKQLLVAGADVNARDLSGDAPLLEAAAKGHRDTATVLLDAKADVNSTNNNGATPLHAAAESGHLEVVKLLIERKANVNAQNEQQATPLLLAVYRQHSAVVKELLAQDANPDLPGWALDPKRYSSTEPGTQYSRAIEHAITRRNAAILSLLLEHGADADGSHTAGWRPLFQAIQAEDVPAVKLLLAHKANPNKPDREGNPPLLKGIRNAEIVRLLLEAGADANARDKDGWPAIFQAVQFRSPAIVKALLEHKADVNAAGPTGWTALHAAVDTRELVELLLAHKADVNARRDGGTTPLDLAKRNAARNQQPRPMRPGLPPPGPTPLSYQWNTSSGSATNEPSSIEDLLRQHGALDDLPDFNSIRITRQGLPQPVIQFLRGTKHTNHFTLLETLMTFYARSSMYSDRTFAPTSGLSFPDFGRIIIRRPSLKPGGKEQEIKVGLLNRSNVVDCAQDVPVQFGDVIEIPERVHALNEAPVDPVREMERVFMEANRATLPERILRGGPSLETNAVMLSIRAQEAARKADAQRLTCLQKTIQLVVAGERTSFSVDSWKEGFLERALAKTEARAALRSSSDLSRVKVTRLDAKTGKSVVLTVDATDANDSLWLHDGDVIEVPDKP